MSLTANLVTLLICTIFWSNLSMAQDFCTEFRANKGNIDFAYGQTNNWFVEISQNNWQFSIDTSGNQPEFKFGDGSASKQLDQSVIVKFMIESNVCGLKADGKAFECIDLPTGTNKTEAPFNCGDLPSNSRHIAVNLNETLVAFISQNGLQFKSIYCDINLDSSQNVNEKQIGHIADVLDESIDPLKKQLLAAFRLNDNRLVFLFADEMKLKFLIRDSITITGDVINCSHNETGPSIVSPQPNQKPTPTPTPIPTPTSSSSSSSTSTSTSSSTSTPIRIPIPSPSPTPTLIPTPTLTSTPTPTPRQTPNSNPNPKPEPSGASNTWIIIILLLVIILAMAGAIGYFFLYKPDKAQLPNKDIKRKREQNENSNSVVDAKDRRFKEFMKRYEEKQRHLNPEANKGLDVPSTETIGFEVNESLANRPLSEPISLNHTSDNPSTITNR